MKPGHAIAVGAGFGFDRGFDMRGLLHQAVIVLLLGGLLDNINTASAGPLLGNNPPYNESVKLELRQYVQMPVGSANVISMTTRLGENALYVTTQEGRVHRVAPGANGTGTRTTFLNLADTNAGGVTISGSSGQQGLQSIAFHPDFDNVGQPGYGKLYATMMRTEGSNNSGPGIYLGSISGPTVAVDGVLAEWTFDHDTETVSGYRELFRVKMALNDHPIKQARFNPYARPGDEDYGLLYMTYGDSNTKPSVENFPQLLRNALGKMIRVDPLDPDGAGSLRYSIPATNPFSGSMDETVLEEIYAYGFRNPHTYSFNRDDTGNVRILAGDIGRNNVEEINSVIAGANYGWPLREGTFVHTQKPDPDGGYGLGFGVEPLPLDEAELGYTFPVAQYDHNAAPNQTSSGSSIASGFVIRNGSDPNLHNQLIFNNFAFKDGIVYHADFGAMLGAVTQLDADDEERNEPGELSQAVLKKLRLALDHDNNPNTPALVRDDFNILLNAGRNDVRYGEGVLGEMYMSTKNGGRIYLVTNSLPLSGDYNKDRVVDAADYVVWRNTLDEFGYHLPADGNGDGKVDTADFAVWQANFGRTWSAGGGSIDSLAAVPEPGTTRLACAGAVAAIVVLPSRRRSYA
jgi:glucose/arabinose dehydrogenase